MTFDVFGLHPAVAAGVAAEGFHTPTPIQHQAIPRVLQGADIMGLAQTGTGKTAAFALPILHRLMTGPRGVVRALIIAPTRELAEQIHRAIESLGRGTRLRSLTLYGGVGLNPQVQKLRRGAEIVVACPGRLLDLMGQGHIQLGRLEVLVLDEADQMFDMGFLPDIRKIVRAVPRERQTMLFSATMPAEIRRLAQEVLRSPCTIQVGDSVPAETVRHAVYPVAPHLKTALLLELLRHTDTDSVLVFTRTKHRARRLGEQLVKSGYRAASLQGNLSQGRRQAAMDGFRDGTFQILVATDIAARGIDVRQISHVVNYDVPSTPEAYIHRIGRTGRAARQGDAFTFASAEDRDLLGAIDRVLGSPVERRTLEGFNYGVPAPARDLEFTRPPRPYGCRSAAARRPAGRASGAGAGTAAGRPWSARPKRRRAESHPPATAARF